MMTQTVAIPKALYGRDFLTLTELNPTELMDLLAYATYIKKLKRSGQAHRLLEGKSVAMYFEKPSNRTRVSFEVGIFDLGAHPIYLRREEVNLGVRETIADTARTLSRYVDAIMIRTFSHRDVESLANSATIPVINGLTDDHHPCQVLADLLTAYEYFGELKGKKLAYVGDGNNMAHSLMLGCVLVGMDVAIATPQGYAPHKAIVAEAIQIGEQTGARVFLTTDIQEAAKGAHVVYTDVWASMGSEHEIDHRRDVFAHYTVNQALMALAHEKAIVLHCLPAHRGEEIDNDTLEAYAHSIFEQAENRLHAQKALLVALMSKP